jgi:5-methyltetrahydrofolate--homocysteine methyltransferase
MDELLKKIYQGILDGNQKIVSDNVQAAMDSGVDPGIILNQSMVSAMAEVGRLFEQGDFYVPEMLIAARAMQAGLTILKPGLNQSNIQSAGKVIIGTVKGDLHDIGKKLVAMMLEGAGFEIIDLGTDVAPEKFIEALKVNGANLIALSALLTTTMTFMKTTIEAVIASGMRDRVKIIIGGAPVTESYALQIGADGYAPDASRAVALAKSLIIV